MPPVLYVRQRDEKLLEELSQRLNNARMDARMSLNTVSARCHTNVKTVTKMVMSGYGHTISMLRVADAMDCDIVLIKRPKKKKIWEIPKAEEQLFKLKQKQLRNKQNERQRTASKREEFDSIERERDFLADDDDPQ